MANRSCKRKERASSKRIVPLAFSVFILMGGCMSHEVKSSNVTFADKVSGSGTVQLTGWAKLYGELNIYSDRDSFDRKLRFPNCISGVFRNQDKRDLSAYDGKQITVTGELFRYSDLPDEDRPVVPRKILGNSVIPNWCYGPNVLLIKTIKLASRSEPKGG